MELGMRSAVRVNLCHEEVTVVRSAHTEMREGTVDLKNTCYLWSRTAKVRLNDKDNDTLIEDGSNLCWTSGLAGMGDGVTTPRKKHRTSGLGVERCWLREGSQYTVRRQYVEICPRVTI